MRHIVGAVSAGGLFIVFYALLGLGLPIAVPASAAGYVAGLLIASRPRRRADLRLDEGESRSSKAAIDTARAKARSIAEFAARVAKPSVRDKAKRLADLAAGIVDDLEKDPSDVARARQFLNYYLDTTITILDHYTTMASKNLPSAQINATLTKAEGMLDTLAAAFEKQRAHLLTDDALNLDTEIKLLEATLKSEAQSNDP